MDLNGIFKILGSWYNEISIGGYWVSDFILNSDNYSWW
jgi:hypothetical protein